MATAGNFVAVDAELLVVGDVGGVSVDVGGFLRSASSRAGGARLPRGGDRVGGDDVDDDSAPVVGVQGVRQLVLTYCDARPLFLSCERRRLCRRLVGAHRLTQWRRRGRRR